MSTDARLILHPIFNRFKQMRYQGVPGVVCIKSDRPGPIVGITACTHGNEPSGLAVLEFLLGEKNIDKELKCGTLFLVVNNIRATERFFNALNEEEVHASRYCDINMNRLPKDALEKSNDSQYEVRRTNELYPIWKQFEYGLDIHSTLDVSDPMIISRGGDFYADLVHGFPIKTLISNIDKVQIGTPAFAFYGGIESKTKVFAIEVGQHSNLSSFKRATECTTALLKNLGMLSSTQTAGSMEYDEYYIDSSILFPDISFDFIKNFKPFDKVSQGDLLAVNKNGKEIRAPFDGHLIMPTSRRGAEKDISEEVAFLSRQVTVKRA